MLFWGYSPHGSPNPSPILRPKESHLAHQFSVLATKTHTRFSDMEEVTKRNIHVYIDRNCVIRLRLGRRQQEDFLKSIYTCFQLKTAQKPCPLE